MELDLIFGEYMKEEQRNIIHSNEILVYRYINIIVLMNYALLRYLYFVWCMTHHTKYIKIQN